MKSALLNPLYKKVQDGVPGLGTPAEMADRFRGDGSPEAAADRIVGVYVGLCGATGFVCGLPGFLMLPITLPTNLAGVAALQLHMCATVAVVGGHDPAHPSTRELSVRCLLKKFDESRDNTEEEEVATRTSVKLAERAVRFTLEQSTRFAKKAARSVVMRKLGARRLPLVGGVLGAGSDAYATTHVGRCAKQLFLT